MPCRTWIRSATEADAEGLAKLCVHTLRDAYAGTMPSEFVDPVSERERAFKIRTAIRSGNRTWLMAVDGDELVGCCALVAARDRDLPAQFGEMVMIAVARSHRRHGHGLALLNAARAEGLHRAWRALVLWVVTANTEARAFYAHAGFIADGGEMTDDHLGFSATVVRYRSPIAARVATTPLAHLSALWRPAWYDLDQALEVAMEECFAFCATAPPNLPGEYDLVFYNSLLDNREPVLYRARILCIRHALLGEVRRIQTAGLAYTVTLVSGDELHVDSEENPGKVDHTSRKDMNQIDNWDFEVELSRVD